MPKALPRWASWDFKNPLAPTKLGPNKNPKLSKLRCDAPSAQKLFLKIMTFSTFFEFFDLRLVSNGHQWQEITPNNYCAPLLMFLRKFKKIILKIFISFTRKICSNDRGFWFGPQWCWWQGYVTYHMLVTLRWWQIRDVGIRINMSAIFCLMYQIGHQHHKSVTNISNIRHQHRSSFIFHPMKARYWARARRTSY